MEWIGYAFAATLIPVGLFGGLFGYPILQVRMIRRTRGGWRALAWLPVPLMACVLGVTLYAFAKQSNVWPIILIFISPVVLLYLLILWALHWRFGPPNNAV